MGCSLATKALESRKEVQTLEWLTPMQHPLLAFVRGFGDPFCDLFFSPLFEVWDCRPFRSPLCEV